MELRLPDGVAQNRNRRRALTVILRTQQPAQVGLHTEHLKVVARNHACVERLRGIVARAPRRDGNDTGLHCSHALDARRPVAQRFVQVVGEHAPVVLQPAADAAV